jgi:hypothetical protein
LVNDICHQVLSADYLLGRLEVVEELDALRKGAMSCREEVHVGGDVVPSAVVVAEDHADAARLFDHKPLLQYVGRTLSDADDDVALHLTRVQ